MIKKLICLIIGHKIWDKVYNGNRITVDDPVVGKYSALTYQRKFNDICPRCGKRLKEKI